MLQPSSDASVTSNVDSMPSGRFTASEWACESPTIATRRGPGGAAVGAGAASVGATVEVGGASNVASPPPAARS